MYSFKKEKKVKQEDRHVTLKCNKNKQTKKVSWISDGYRLVSFDFDKLLWNMSWLQFIVYSTKSFIPIALSSVEFGWNKSTTVQYPGPCHQCQASLECFQTEALLTAICIGVFLALSRNIVEGHRLGCSELWSLSWLSSSVAVLGKLAEHCSPTIPENSEGSSIPFFTFANSFSWAAAPCWPPLTRFHFILLFWNQTFTWQERLRI